VLVDALFLPIPGDGHTVELPTGVLGPHDMTLELIGFEDVHRAQELDLLVPDRIRPERRGRLHRG